MIRRLRTWAAARRAERRALAEYRSALRNLARLRNAQRGNAMHKAGRTGRASVAGPASQRATRILGDSHESHLQYRPLRVLAG